jgi:hypothetical protein
VTATPIAAAVHHHTHDHAKARTKNVRIGSCRRPLVSELAIGVPAPHDRRLLLAALWIPSRV